MEWGWAISEQPIRGLLLVIWDILIGHSYWVVQSEKEFIKVTQSYNMKWSGGSEHSTSAPQVSGLHAGSESHTQGTRG